MGDGKHSHEFGRDQIPSGARNKDEARLGVLFTKHHRFLLRDAIEDVVHPQQTRLRASINVRDDLGAVISAVSATRASSEGSP